MLVTDYPSWIWLLSIPVLIINFTLEYRARTKNKRLSGKEPKR